MMKDPVADSTIKNCLKVARQEANLWVMVTDVRHNVTTQYKLIQAINENIINEGSRATIRPCGLVDSLKQRYTL